MAAAASARRSATASGAPPLRLFPSPACFGSSRPACAMRLRSRRHRPTLLRAGTWGSGSFGLVRVFPFVQAGPVTSGDARESRKGGVGGGGVIAIFKWGRCRPRHLRAAMLIRSRADGGVGGPNKGLVSKGPQTEAGLGSEPGASPRVRDSEPSVSHLRPREPARREFG